MYQPISLLLEPYHCHHHHKFHVIIRKLSISLKNIFSLVLNGMTVLIGNFCKVLFITTPLSYYLLISLYHTVVKISARVYIQVSQEEGTKLRESVPYVKIYRYNPKHLSKVERLRR